jgi:hypothetical protein
MHRVNAEAAQGAQTHPLYSTWRSITRAAGGKLVCSKWKTFSHFVADIVEKPEGTKSFERIDRSGIFEPGNVVWGFPSGMPEDLEERAKYMREYNKRKRSANPDYFWNASLKKMYGVTVEWYNEQYEKQNGVCAICKRAETAKIRGKVVRLAVDHCHKTGKVRGLLCMQCNRGIGNLNHDARILQSALEYLDINS